MKIGIISDTHDRLESVEKAIEVFKENGVETVIHCGDWVAPFVIDFWDTNTDDFRVPVYSIFGNNEGEKIGMAKVNASLSNPIKFSDKPILELNIEGKKIAVIHGHDKNKLQEAIVSERYDVIFTGHTHSQRNEIIGRTLVINPGSTCFAAESKIIDKASVAIYNTADGSIKFIEFSKNDL